MTGRPAGDAHVVGKQADGRTDASVRVAGDKDTVPVQRGAGAVPCAVPCAVRCVWSKGAGAPMAMSWSPTRTLPLRSAAPPATTSDIHIYT